MHLDVSSSLPPSVTSETRLGELTSPSQLRNEKMSPVNDEEDNLNNLNDDFFYNED